MENGYHLYDFKGTLLREEHIERFKQWLWRPRPPTLLSKEEQKKIRKNLREYSKVFEEQDQIKRDAGNRQVVEARRRLLEEWRAWRAHVIELLREEGAEDAVPLPEKGEGEALDDEKEAEEVEEIVEEIVEETEEVVA